jgi:hypothetical protein
LTTLIALTCLVVLTYATINASHSSQRERIRKHARQLDLIVPATVPLYAVNPRYQPYLFYLRAPVRYASAIDELPLGAQPSTVLRMFMREGSIMLFSGLALGFLLAMTTEKILSGMLDEVGALDPVAFTNAPLLLAAAALLATWLPARRATRVNPMTALRTE